jgi:hypothetical protein
MNLLKSSGSPISLSFISDTHVLVDNEVSNEHGGIGRSPPSAKAEEMTEVLDMDDVVPCSHCEGVLLGRWEDHQVGCPAISTEDACGRCETAMDDLAKQRL